MSIDPTPAWTCPVCRTPLRREQKSHLCANNHCFDTAKEGYVNLLLAQNKHSANPGDDRAMLLNRREFLEKGHYQPLVRQLGVLCSAYAAELKSTSRPFVLLDTGCGEGYYTHAIAQALEESAAEQAHHISGVDIAKDAVRMAARRYKAIHFAVASNAGLPIADQHVDCLLQVFAPGYETEITRVLRPGGVFIRVSPGMRHLYQLREMVYDHPKLHEVAEPGIKGLALEQHLEVRFELQLTEEGDPARLLTMTPYYWQASREKQERILALGTLNTEAHFNLDCFRAPV